MSIIKHFKKFHELPLIEQIILDHILKKLKSSEPNFVTLICKRILVVWCNDFYNLRINTVILYNHEAVWVS